MSGNVADARSAVLVFFLAAGAACLEPLSAAERFLIAERGKAADCSIVIAVDARPSCVYAAEELQNHVREMTGVELGIERRTCPVGDARAIILEIVEDPILGTDGFRLKVDGDTLRVSGGVRGVLYGVYELLETYGGCGWYASWRTVIPKRDVFSVPRGISDSQTPSFLLREPSWMDVKRHPDFAARLRMNGAGGNLGAKHGGAAYRFVKGLPRSHTFDRFLPAERYFKDHPEWFAEIDGQRRGEKAQICLTNPEALEESVKNIVKMVEADPDGARVVGISQNDNRACCTCAKCRAVNAEEASSCGTLMRFVNAVAARLEERFPGILVQTLVYQFTRKPPKLTRPRPNVMPCFCTYEAEFAHPLTESEYVENVAIVKEMREWGRRTDNLFVWDYSTNWRFFQQPMATVYSLQPNFRFFLENGAKYLYCEGGPYHADFANLRAWLIAKLSWNAEADVDALIDRFFRECYGSAAPHARAAFDRLHEIYRAKRKAVLTIWHRDLRNVLTDEDLDGLLSEWDKALAVARATGDDELVYTVRAAAFPAVATKLNRYAEDMQCVGAPPEDARALYDRGMAFWEEARRRKHTIRTGEGDRTRRTRESWNRLLMTTEAGRKR